MTADLVVELHGKRVGMLAGPWRAFGFLPDPGAVAEFGIDSPVLSVAIPLTAVPVRSRKARRQNFFRELLPLLGDGLAVLAPRRRTRSACAPRPRARPPATVGRPRGRVHGDPVVQLDDVPVAPGGCPGLDSGDPGSCRADRLRMPPAARLRADFLQLSGGTAKGCGDSAGILKIAVATCVIRFSHFRLFAGQNGLKLTKIWSR